MPRSKPWKWENDSKRFVIHGCSRIRSAWLRLLVYVSKQSGIGVAWKVDDLASAGRLNISRCGTGIEAAWKAIDAMMFLSYRVFAQMTCRLQQRDCHQRMNRWRPYCTDLSNNGQEEQHRQPSRHGRRTGSARRGGGDPRSQHRSRARGTLPSKSRVNIAAAAFISCSFYRGVYFRPRSCASRLRAVFVVGSSLAQTQLTVGATRAPLGRVPYNIKDATVRRRTSLGPYGLGYCACSPVDRRIRQVCRGGSTTHRHNGG